MLQRRKAIQGPSDDGGPLAGRAHERLIHGVADRLRAELSPSSAKSVFVDVNQVLRHAESIYDNPTVYIRPRPYDYG